MMVVALTFQKITKSSFDHCYNLSIGLQDKGSQCLPKLPITVHLRGAHALPWGFVIDR